MELNAFTIVIGLVILGLGIWTAVDAGSHPDWAWQRAGQNKLVWILVPLIGAFICGIVTIVMTVIYHASIKQQVVAAERGGI
jgi:hypothetical protein